MSSLRLPHPLAGPLYRRSSQDAITEVRVEQAWPLIMAAALIALAIFLPARVWIVLLVGWIAALGLCFGWALVLARAVRFERRLLHTWVQVGDLLEEAMTLTNDSPVPLLAGEVEDLSDVPGYAQNAIRAVPPMSRTAWRQEGRSRRRGLFRLGPTRLRFTDPFGMFRVVIDYPHTREVLVFPPVLQRIEVRMPPGAGYGAAISRQRSLAETAAISSVRDYHPGDPIRRIHWPLSERHHHLLVKEFDREMGGSVWLAADFDSSVHRGSGDESTVEDVIVWAASWAYHLMRQGKRAGLFAYGPDRIAIPPAAGSAHFWAMLRALAPVEAQGTMPLEGLIAEITPRLVRGDSLAVITPSRRAAWVESLARPALRGTRKAAVVITSPPVPLSEIGEGETRAGEFFAMLAAMGIPVTRADQRVRLDAMPAAEGTGDWQFATTPHGRVIVRSRPQKVGR